jgi:EpsI family protein
VYIAYYRRQDYDRKLVSSENVLVKLDSDFWVQVARGEHAVQMGARRIPMRSASLRGSGHPVQAAMGNLRVLQSYWVGGTLTSNDVEAKLLAAWHRLTGRGDDSAVIVLYMPQSSDQAVLDRFVSENLGTIESILLAKLGN